MFAVECKNLKKSFHTGEADVWALQGIDLQIKLGEMFMLVGPSGCGKTTLISIIAGILNQDSGDCVVLGTDLKKLNQKQMSSFRGRHIGFVFQALNLIPALTAKENVAVPLIINGVETEEAYRRAVEVLNKVDLSSQVNRLPRELSGGQQQRVAIARALIHDPEILVCDEPTSALDEQTGHRVMEMFQKVARKSNRALIIVTHDPRIYSFADRIARINDGKVERIEVNKGLYNK